MTSLAHSAALLAEFAAGAFSALDSATSGLAADAVEFCVGLARPTGI